MAGSCPCGDLRCVCVRPCLCCSCTCWCDECRLLRKGRQFCDLCTDASNNKASMCGVICKVDHHHESRFSSTAACSSRKDIETDEDSDEPLLKIDDRCSSSEISKSAEGSATNVQGCSKAKPESLVTPQCIQENLFIASHSRGGASGCISSATACFSPRKDFDTDEDSDEPMLEIDDRYSSSETPKSAEGSATDAPGCSKFNLNLPFQSSSQPRKKMIDLSGGGLLLDDNRNIVTPEEYRQQLISKRFSNLNLSRSASQESEAMKSVPGCSHSDQTDSKSEESKISGTTSFAESLKMNLKELSLEDSALSEKFLGISRSPTSPLSISLPSAFSIPQPRQEVESGQRASSAQSSSMASTSRRMSSIKISNAHAAEKKASKCKSSVKLIPEPPAIPERPVIPEPPPMPQQPARANPPRIFKSQFSKIFNDFNDKKTTAQDQKAQNSASSVKVPSPEKSDNHAGRNPPEDNRMQESSDESEEESSSSKKTDNVSRKC